MILVKQMHRILRPDPFNAMDIYLSIEESGRVAYQSFDKSDSTSYEKLIKSLIKQDHLSVLEHASMKIRFITDRGVTHELVRHRLMSPTQESTRYCNYGRKDDIMIILPVEFYEDCSSEDYKLWYDGQKHAEETYLKRLALGTSPQLARENLTNSLASMIDVTANMREWRHIFKLRRSKTAHPQIVALMNETFYDVNSKLPLLFGDLA